MRSFFYRWVFLFAVLLALILVPFFLFGDAIDAWIQHTVRESPGGSVWVAVLLGGVLASDIVLPIPSSFASTACGNLLGMWVGALTSLLGMTVSCVAGYWVGLRGGRPAAQRLVGARDLARLERWSRRFGDWTIVVARPVPVLAEASVVVVGMGRMQPGRFLLLAVLANTGISLVYAAVGAYAAHVNAFLPAFIFSMALPGIAMLAARLFNPHPKPVNGAERAP